jgi:hypothetical protein
MLKNSLIKIVCSFIFLIPLITLGNQVYDHSLNETVFERSEFYYKKQRADDYKEFLSGITTDTRIFVHFHGCGGLYYGDYDIKSEYQAVDGAVIFVNFLKRSGVTASCMGGKSGNTSEASNTTRINIRRSEVEVLVKDLQSKGYNNIYISGHSEGGRVASTWTIPVKGVIIHGMDCNLHQFWNIQRNQKTLVMFSWRDEWLSAQRSLTSCSNSFNKGWVTELNSYETSHVPFYNKFYVEEFKKWLLK